MYSSRFVENFCGDTLPLEIAAKRRCEVQARRRKMKTKGDRKQNEVSGLIELDISAMLITALKSIEKRKNLQMRNSILSAI